jgi:hypothetical protein
MAPAGRAEALMDLSRNGTARFIDSRKGRIERFLSALLRKRRSVRCVHSSATSFKLSLSEGCRVVATIRQIFAAHERGVVQPLRRDDHGRSRSLCEQHVYPGAI